MDTNIVPSPQTHHLVLGHHGDLGQAAAELATEGFVNVPGPVWVGLPAKAATSKTNSAIHKIVQVSYIIELCSSVLSLVAFKSGLCWIP